MKSDHTFYPQFPQELLLLNNKIHKEVNRTLEDLKE